MFKEFFPEPVRKPFYVVAAVAVLALVGIFWLYPSSAKGFAKPVVHCYSVTVKRWPSGFHRIRVNGCTETPGYAPTARRVAHDLHSMVIPPWLHVSHYSDRHGVKCIFVYGGNGDTSARVCNNGTAHTS